MDIKRNLRSQNHRSSKLSLKKNKLINDVESKKPNRSSDVIILDESINKLKSPKSSQSKPLLFSPIRKPLLFSPIRKPLLFSPIHVHDSGDLSDDDLPKISLEAKEPSKNGNLSFNCSRDNLSPSKESRPSIGGWSPRQHIITANPRHDPKPSTPKDVMNESHEQCSIKKIQQSQKKILNDVYGNAWKSIPALFKTISHKYENFDGVTKKLFDDDEDKENIRHDLQRNKELYLTNSDVKRIETNFGDTEKKSKKRLFTEKVPNTPVTKQKPQRIRNVNSTTKKVKITKGMSVTELVEIMRNDAVDINSKVDTVDVLMDKIENEIDVLTKKGPNVDDKKKCDKVEKLTERIESVSVTPKNDVKRLSFMGSLADNVPSWRCHVEALQYRDNYKNLREQLARRLYKEFNKSIFGDILDADLAIVWDGKLRSTAGTTTNRQVKNANGDRIRTSSIKLSTKVLDTPMRLRDTLIHELCHAATWLIDSELRAGHGPLWKKWAFRSIHIFPELGEISRCHDMEIHFKYSYKCTNCGYSIQRHSKSIDIIKKCCGHCRGKFEIVVNKKNKDGVVVTTPARKGATNGFALYVKENYASVKEAGKSHAQVMKLLGEQYSMKKNKPVD